MARFNETFCSQCGGSFGPGDSGFSHCDQHQTMVACPACCSPSGSPRFAPGCRICGGAESVTEQQAEAWDGPQS